MTSDIRIIVVGAAGRMGRTLVRQIARAHAGEARCEAAPGGGSRFVITFSHPERSPGHQDGKEPTDAEEADPDRR